MGINVFPAPTTASSIATGWTAGVAGTFLLSNTLTTGTYLVKTDSTQTMTITLVDSDGHNYAGTIRGGSGFITVATAVNQIKIPGSLTYPFGIEITPVSVTQLAAPTSLSLSLDGGGIIGTWGTVPTGATGAVLFTTTGDVINFASTASGAIASGITTSNTVPNSVNNFVVAFKNSSGAIGIGATFAVTMPAAPYPYYVEYLVVGAGGSSGGPSNPGSGGGGGAVKTSTTLASNLVGSTFTISVAAAPAQSASGGSSTFGYGSTTITATGGAGGVGYNLTGNNGASGSGGHSNGSTTVYNGGTGNDGGNGGASQSPDATYNSTGGGGGAGGAASGWNSGNGIASSITGTSTYYAGGGAGGKYTSSGSIGSGGTARGTSAAANTGAGAGSGGGGGSSYIGGSGFVVYAYPSTAAALTTIPGTLTYTVDTTTRTGYRVYKFTAGSGTVTV
jgi:hypothetical protein